LDFKAEIQVLKLINLKYKTTHHYLSKKIHKFAKQP
jgi:hypothetical protein